MTECKKQENDLSKVIEQKTKNQFEVIKRIDAYIGTTNTKCTIIMSYCAAVIALIFALLGRLDLSIPNPTTVLIGLSCGFSLITAAICMLMACLTIFPATFSSPDKNRGVSLIFYGDIAASKGGTDGYVKRVAEISDEDYLNDLSGQVFTLAKIASHKFWLIQKLSIVLCIHFLCITTFLAACIYHLLA